MLSDAGATLTVARCVDEEELIERARDADVIWLEWTPSIGRSTSDFVSLHLPVSELTHHMINSAALARMKPGAALVNTSRGGLIDQSALLDALESGVLSGAAMDVFEPEPLPQDHPLRRIPSVILTPHQGASSDRSLVDLRLEMRRATGEWITDGWTAAIVNPGIRGRQRGLLGS